MIFIKKLPKIYQSSIDKKINNNKSTYHLKYNEEEDRSLDTMDNISVNEVIDSIFNTTGYAFNIPVIIKTRNNIYNTNIISKRNGYILTIDQDRINIEDIIFIQIKNP